MFGSFFSSCFSRMLALPQPLMSTSEMSLAVSDHVAKVTDLCGSEEECAWNQVDLGLGHSSVTSGLKRAGDKLHSLIRMQVVYLQVLTIYPAEEVSELYNAYQRF